MHKTEYKVLPPLESGTIVKCGEAYEITGNTVNAGGFGRIYRAVRVGDNPLHSSYPRKCAIKEFHLKDLVHVDDSSVSMGMYTQNLVEERLPALRSKFYREAKMLQFISHSPFTPNILSYVHEEDGRSLYAMEYIDGPTLTEEVNNWGPMPEAEAVYFIYQIGDLLRDAHRRGIIHSDISPNNIIISFFNDEFRHHFFDHDIFNVKKAVLVDFGNARSYDDKRALSSMNTSAMEKFLPYQEALDRSIEREGVTEEYMNELALNIGSSGFIAPIQFRGTILGDVYSLAATLYYTLTGERPSSLQDAQDKMLRALERRHISQETVSAILHAMELSPESYDIEHGIKQFLKELRSSGKSCIRILY